MYTNVSSYQIPTYMPTLLRRFARTLTTTSHHLLHFSSRYYKTRTSKSSSVVLILVSLHSCVSRQCSATFTSLRRAQTTSNAISGLLSAAPEASKKPYRLLARPSAIVTNAIRAWLLLIRIARGQPSVDTTLSSCTTFYIKPAVCHLMQSPQSFSSILPTNFIMLHPSHLYSSMAPRASSYAIFHSQRIISTTKINFQNKFSSHSVTSSDSFQPLLSYCFSAQRLSRNLCFRESLLFLSLLLSTFQSASHCNLCSLQIASFPSVYPFPAPVTSLKPVLSRRPPTTLESASNFGN